MVPAKAPGETGPGVEIVITVVYSKVQHGWTSVTNPVQVPMIAASDTGAVAATVAVPGFPSDVAVIDADPVACALTRPAFDTVATTVLLLDQVTARPESSAPAASRSSAVS